jgi:hypothetical protein
MDGTRTSASGWMLSTMLTILASWLLAAAIPANAQGTKGQNAVYSAPGTCCKGSSSFIDASMFATTPPPPIDFCKVLNWVLTHGYPATGAVIDARGLSSTNTSMTCMASPWAGITNPPPSTILLPATGGSTPTPIIIPSTWALPNNTRLIGEGDGITSTGFTLGTTIQAVANSFSGSSMIQFGASAGVCLPPNAVSVCSGISVEKLTLDGQGQAINGITNQLAGVQSYVDHVSLYRILGTGLSVSLGANDSGPYSNIAFDLGSVSGASSTVCASINGLTGTRGIHGLSCIAENNDPQAAVLLDSSNNSIEDVRIVGFYDGIRVGANNNAQSNVLVNIYGDTTEPTCKPTCFVPIHVVHIYNVGNVVTDLSIMGLSNAAANTTTIDDDLTGTSLSDTSVGIYALGQAINGGHSRYTTSPNTAHWTVGTAGPSGSCHQGSLYSCTGASNACSHALWVCVPGPTWSVVR